MTLGDIAKKARSLSNTNINNYSDADLLIDINIWYQKVATMILEAQDDADFDDQRNTTYPMKDIPMVALQMDYPIPTTEKLLKLKDVSITYDGVNYYRANPIDSTEIPMGMSPSTATVHLANLDRLFTKTSPGYDWKYGSIFPYPRATTADVANGASIHAEWSRQITPFVIGDYTSVLTDSTVVPGFDDPFHPILSYGPASEKSINLSLPQITKLENRTAEYEMRIKQSYSNKNKDRQYVIGTDIPNYGAKSRTYWNNPYLK